MKRLHFLFCVAMSLCAGVAYAQTDSTLQAVQELRRVDVVAERQTSAVSATVPVQTVDRERMLRLGIHTMTDALRHLAGITVRDYGGAEGMKTVFVRGIGARHTAVVYDGIALSDCQTGEIDLSRYSLEQLSSLRLVIGDDDNIFQPARNQAAAATLYLSTHSQRSQGVEESRSQDDSQRNCEEQSTPLAREGQRGESALSVGSFDLVNPSFRLNLPSLLGGDGGGASLFGEFFHADNDYPFTLHNVTLMTHERRSNSHMNAGRGELNLDWQLASRSTLLAKAYYYNNHRRLPGIVHLYTSENHERLAEQTAFGQLTLRSQLSAQWALLAHAKYNWANTDYENRTPGSGIGDARYWQREAYASASVLCTPARWLALDYALDLQQNSLNSTLLTYASHPHRTLLLQALSAKASFQRLTLVARALYHFSHEGSNDSSHHLENASQLAPSLSLAWQLPANLRLRLMAKRIFRLPTFNELYFYHIGSADLRPEKTTQFNLGLTWELARPLDLLTAQITLDAYANRVSDKIVAVPFNMFVWRIMNIGQATIHGLDLTANAAYRLNTRHILALSGNYSLQRAMNTTSRSSSTYRNQLPYTPLHTYCATLTWENPWANVAATFCGQTARWTTVEHSSGTRIDPFATTDLSLWRAIPLLHRSATLRFTLQNLFNKQYDIVAHYPMPGRSWRVQLVVPLG